MTTKAWRLLVIYRQGAFELEHRDVSFSERSLNTYSGKSLYLLRGGIYRYLSQSPSWPAMSRLCMGHFFVFYEIVLLVEVASFGKSLNIISLL